MIAMVNMFEKEKIHAETFLNIEDEKVACQCVNHFSNLSQPQLLGRPGRTRSEGSKCPV